MIVILNQFDYLLCQDNNILIKEISKMTTMAADLKSSLQLILISHTCDIIMRPLYILLSLVSSCYIQLRIKSLLDVYDGCHGSHFEQNSTTSHESFQIFLYLFNIDLYTL